MIKGCFERFVRPKAARFSDGEFRIGVHAFDDTERNFSSCCEPVEQEYAVRPQSLDETLDGRQA
jgi:hypothetical protein